MSIINNFSAIAARLREMEGRPQQLEHGGPCPAQGCGGVLIRMLNVDSIANFYYSYDCTTCNFIEREKK